MSICDLFILNGVACNLSPVQFTQQQSSFNSMRKLDHKTLSVWFHRSNVRLHSVRHSLLGDGKNIWKISFFWNEKRSLRVCVYVCRERLFLRRMFATCITFKLPYLFGCGTKVYSFICRRILSRHFSLLYIVKKTSNWLNSTWLAIHFPSSLSSLCAQSSIGQSLVISTSTLSARNCTNEPRMHWKVDWCRQKKNIKKRSPQNQTERQIKTRLSVRYTSFTGASVSNIMCNFISIDDHCNASSSLSVASIGDDLCTTWSRSVGE